MGGNNEYSQRTLGPGWPNDGVNYLYYIDPPANPKTGVWEIKYKVCTNTSVINKTYPSAVYARWNVIHDFDGDGNGLVFYMPTNIGGDDYPEGSSGWFGQPEASNPGVTGPCYVMKIPPFIS